MRPLDASPAILSPLIRRLTLRDFRSYAALDARFGSRTIALTGENGAGKTNILEALSMFSPGRGLRRAEIGLCARHDGPGASRFPSNWRRMVESCSSAMDWSPMLRAAQL